MTVDHNTVFHTSNIVLIDGAQSQGFVFTNNLMKHNTYGIFGSNAGIGNATLAAYFPSAVVRRNVLAGGSASLYPTDNFFPSVTTFYAQFVDYSGGNYALVSGSPYIARATDGKNIGADLTALKSGPGVGQWGHDHQRRADGQPRRTVQRAARNGHRVQRQQFERLGRLHRRRIDGTWGDGTSTGSGATPSHTYASAGTYTVRLTVTDNVGATGSATTTASVQAPTTSAGDIVLTAADVTVIRGGWARISSTSGSGGQMMSSADNGWSQKDAPLGAPANYFEVPFMAAANTNYRVWLRMRAKSDSWRNDSTWVQFTGAVTSQRRPAVAHGDDQRVAGEPRGVLRMWPVRLGLAGPRLLDLGAAGAVPVRGPADAPHPDAGRRSADRSDRAQSGDLLQHRARSGEERRDDAAPDGGDAEGDRRGAPRRRLGSSGAATGRSNPTAPARTDVGLAVPIRGGRTPAPRSPRRPIT